MILMGELHGTVEAPASFSASVCRALERRLSVSVGLELGPDQVEPLATYLASDGGEPAVARLLRTSFWSREFQDGRSSAAMLRLIEDLRLMKQRSADLNVFVLEAGHGGPDAAAGRTRDQRMAASVRAERKNRPAALILTLTGNIHNLLEPLAAMDHGRAIPIPMGALLKDLAPRSVRLQTTGGSAWVCTPACGIDMFPRFANANPSGAYQKRAGSELYQAVWWLGPSTASLPAIQNAPGSR